MTLIMKGNSNRQRAGIGAAVAEFVFIQPSATVPVWTSRVVTVNGSLLR
jgi:hypothetical protein